MTTVEVLMEHDGESVLVGTAYFTRRRGEITTTFLYDPGYLSSGGTSIDPALPPVPGAQYRAGLVRAFADSAPDRWGRNLIIKAERIRAREERQSPRQLDDLDFLLGVSDNTRQGALRYRFPGSSEFLGEPSTVPKLLELPELLRAADAISADEDPASAIKHLLDTGTTGLGGARPKASVRLQDGALAIAKFPHHTDKWDVMAWEATALDLLAGAGIRVPDHRLLRIGGRSVLILRRFDRTASGTRIGYISALTALGAVDGERRDYADCAEAIRDLCQSPQAAHHELFDRVVAYVALGNIDDHLRNHGFLADAGLWTLSPAFDVNPNPDPWQARATSIMGADTVPEEAEALLALADECSMTPAHARERMARIGAALRDWRAVARANDIHDRDISLFSKALDARISEVESAARGGVSGSRGQPGSR